MDDRIREWLAADPCLTVAEAEWFAALTALVDATEPEPELADVAA